MRNRDKLKRGNSSLMKTNTFLFLKNIQHCFKGFLQETSLSRIETHTNVSHQNVRFMFNKKERKYERQPNHSFTPWRNQNASRYTDYFKGKALELQQYYPHNFGIQTSNETNPYENHKVRSVSINAKMSPSHIKADAFQKIFDINKNKRELPIAKERTSNILKTKKFHHSRIVADNFKKDHNSKYDSIRITTNKRNSLQKISRGNPRSKAIELANSISASGIVQSTHSMRKDEPTKMIRPLENNQNLKKLLCKEQMNEQFSRKQKKEIERIKTFSLILGAYNSDTDATSKMSDDETRSLSSPTYDGKIPAKTRKALNEIGDDLAMKEKILILGQRQCRPNCDIIVKSHNCQKNPLLDEKKHASNLDSLAKNEKHFRVWDESKNHQILWDDFPDAIESSLITCSEKIDQIRIALSKDLQKIAA